MISKGRVVPGSASCMQGSVAIDGDVFGKGSWEAS
jgi:hypothetical protein